jgi:hypothetical protein
MVSVMFSELDGIELDQDTIDKFIFTCEIRVKKISYNKVKAFEVMLNSDDVIESFNGERNIAALLKIPFKKYQKMKCEYNKHPYKTKRGLLQNTVELFLEEDEIDMFVQWLVKILQKRKEQLKPKMILLKLTANY